MMITYENQNGKKDSRGNRQWGIDVRLEGKIVGVIESVAQGFRYVPKGRKKLAGEVYPTLAAVKRSLEAE